MCVLKGSNLKTSKRLSNLKEISQPQDGTPRNGRFPTPRFIVTSALPSSTLASLVTSISPFTLNMESRKRPHSIEDEPTIQKKRILTSVNGTPHVNSVVSDADEPRDDENLEVNTAWSILLQYIF